ncbi:MAG: heme A synthase [Alphaproteobacteria bacterium]|nr:heme A synthase [Alphaproteobacteria bacterium]
MDATPASSDPRAVGRWLLVVAAVIALTVVVGGLTRLTESGLSIVEWRPITGVLPPLSAAAWEQAFAQYKASPEYLQVNAGMSMAAFQAIYWMEWGHRLLARAVGMIFLIPFLCFLVRSRIPSRFVAPLVVVFVLGGLQGALGWYMVQSGLVDRPDVSHYRLAAHLGLAVAIYGYVVALALELLWPRRSGRADPLLTALAGWIFIVLLSGALVAGLDAGFLHNTFPLMDGRWIPEGLSLLSPWILNLLENPTGVQFLHRLLAAVTVALIVALWWWRRPTTTPMGRRALDGLLLMVVVQAALGIATLLLVVPISLAVTHQAGAVALLTMALVARHVAPR